MDCVGVGEVAYMQGANMFLKPYQLESGPKDKHIPTLSHPFPYPMYVCVCACVCQILYGFCFEVKNANVTFPHNYIMGCFGLFISKEENVRVR
jgi:hypothetical protein